MSVLETRPNVIDFGTFQQHQRPIEAPQQPGLMNLLAQGLGQGIGGGFQKEIEGHLKRSAIERAIGMAGPNASPLQQYMSLAQADPEMAKHAIPLFEQNQKQNASNQQNSSFQRAIDQVVGHNDQQSQGQPQSPMQQVSGQGQEQASSIPRNAARNSLRNKKIDLSGLNADQTSQVVKLIQDKEKTARDETKDFRKNQVQEAKSYTEGKQWINKLRQKDATGKLDSAGWAKIAEVFDMPGILTPESQEYNKLLTEALPKMKEIFGGVLSDNDVKLFLTSLPTLKNTPEGRELIFRNFELANEAKRVRRDIYRDLTNRYGIYEGMDEDLQELSEPILEQLAQSWGSPQGQNPQNTIPSNSVRMKLPNGEIGYIPKFQVKTAISRGAQVLE